MRPPTRSASRLPGRPQGFAAGRPGVDARRRALDLAIAVPALAVAAPLLAAVGVVVRLADGPPVLFRQERSGRHGRPFRIHKFRTMREPRAGEDAAATREARITRVGHLLRRTSLDELPQLWDIVRGDMAVVGPRPLPVRYLERYTAEQRRRLEVRPGLTGWAQVAGRNAVDWPQRLDLDVWYVDHRSLSLDLRIIARTVGLVIRGEGLAAEGDRLTEEFMGVLAARDGRVAS